MLRESGAVCGAAFVLALCVGACAGPPPRAEGLYEGLGFTLSESEALKVSDRLPSMISFTEGGRRGALTPGDPLFLAGSSVTGAEPGDPADFARRLLRATAELGELEIVSQAPLRLGGLPADEIIATAVEGRTGTPLRVYQALVLDGRRYFLLQGMVAVTKAESIMPQFREIAHSFERTPERP